MHQIHPLSLDMWSSQNTDSRIHTDEEAVISATYICITSQVIFTDSCPKYSRRVCLALAVFDRLSLAECFKHELDWDIEEFSK